MKIKTGLILVFCMIFFLTGCNDTTNIPAGTAVNLYYVGNEETKVEVREYSLQAKDMDGQLEEVLLQLSTPPSKLEYKAPLSMGFSLLEYEVEDGRLQLDMDEAYKTLKPTTEVLVRAALVRSLTQIEGVGYISITVEGEQLHDSLGNVVGLMTAEQFIDNAGNEINSYERARLKLYFSSEDGTALIATNRTVAYSTNIPMERLVVEQILSGPDIGEVFPTVNSETKLLSVTVKDGVCYVNLDNHFLTQTSNVTTDVAIYSIVNSLTELKTVNKVQLSIEGETKINYRDTYSLTTIFERNLDLVTTLN